MKDKFLASVSAVALIAMSSVAIAQGQDKEQPGQGGQGGKGDGGRPAQSESRGPGPQQGSDGPARAPSGAERRGGGDQGGQQRSDGGERQQRAQGSDKSEQQRSEPRRDSENQQRGSQANERSNKGETKGKSEASEKRKSGDGGEQERRAKAQAEREERKKDTSKKAEPKEKGKAATSTDTKSGDQSKSSEDRQRPADKSAEPKAGTKEQQKDGQQPATAQPGAPGAVEKGQDSARTERGDQRGRLQLSGEQRNQVRENIVRLRPQRVTNINVTVRIGERLPRRVNLSPVPAVLVSVLPAYRNYRYVVIRDEICIVDPATYEIVEVIEYSDGPGVTTASRSESREIRVERADNVDFVIGGGESTRIYRLISQRYRPVDLRVRLALGIDIPETVTLQEFPQEVIEIEPRLRRYRFVFADEHVLVIEPSNRDVVMLFRN